MIGLFEVTNFDYRLSNYRDNLNLEDTAIEYIKRFSNKHGFEIVDINIKPAFALQFDEAISIKDLTYKLKYNDNIYTYKTFLPDLVDGYIIINGLRYTFILSQTDWPITQFGTYSTDIKLSNLYRKVVFKNILDSNTTNIYYESKFGTIPILALLLLFVPELTNRQYTDIYQMHRDLYDILNIKYTENDIQSKKQKAKIRTEQLDNFTFKHYVFDKEFTIEVNPEINNFIYLALKTYKVTSQKGKKIIDPLPSLTKPALNIMSEFKAMFDPYTSDLLQVKDHIDFIYKYLLNGYIIDVAKKSTKYTDVSSKQATIKQFMLYPLTRQLAHLTFVINLRGKDKLPFKHTISTSLLYKSMQVELADGKMPNPAAEIALNCKITYMHKFALTRTGQNVRMLFNFKGILDPIATPETKKTGATNYLVADPKINIT